MGVFSMTGCSNPADSSGGADTGYPPAAPLAISVFEAHQQLTITWNAVSAAENYTVYYSQGTEHTAAEKQENVTENSILISGLTNDVTYNVWIRAHNQHGPGNVSSPVTGIPAAALAVPDRPVITEVKATDPEKLAVTWNAVSGAISYNVYCSTTAVLPGAPAETGGTFTRHCPQRP